MTKTKINTGAAVENHRQKDQGNASPKWIEAIQRQVKIGDTVNVKTNKCCSVEKRNRDRHFPQLCSCTPSERCMRKRSMGRYHEQQYGG